MGKTRAGLLFVAGVLLPLGVGACASNNSTTTAPATAGPATTAALATTAPRSSLSKDEVIKQADAVCARVRAEADQLPTTDITTKEYFKQAFDLLGGEADELRQLSKRAPDVGEFSSIVDDLEQFVATARQDLDELADAADSGRDPDSPYVEQRDALSTRAASFGLKECGKKSGGSGGSSGTTTTRARGDASTTTSVRETTTTSAGGATTTAGSGGSSSPTTDGSGHYSSDDCLQLSLRFNDLNGQDDQERQAIADQIKTTYGMPPDVAANLDRIVAAKSARQAPDDADTKAVLAWRSKVCGS